MRPLNLAGVAQLCHGHWSLSNGYHVQVHHQRAFCLKLRRAEEVRRQSAARVPNALGVARRASIQDIDVKLKPGSFGETPQKIYVLLLNKEIVVGDRNDRVSSGT